MKLALKNNVGTNRYHQRKMLDEILKTHLSPNNKTRTYHLDENDYNRAMIRLSPTLQDNALKYHDFVK